MAALAPLVGPVGFIMPLSHSVSLPWDAGPISQTQQTFQWQATCTTSGCAFP